LDEIEVCLIARCKRSQLWSWEMRDGGQEHCGSQSQDLFVSDMEDPYLGIFQVQPSIRHTR
jgi:hypothetical protein